MQNSLKSKKSYRKFVTWVRIENISNIPFVLAVVVPIIIVKITEDGRLPYSHAWTAASLGVAIILKIVIRNILKKKFKKTNDLKGEENESFL